VIVFQCPECNDKFEVETQYGGRQWRCVSCQASITIPEAGEPMEPIMDAPARRDADEPIREGRRRLRDYDAEEREAEERRHRRGTGWDGDERLVAQLWPGWVVTRVGVRVLGTGVSIFLVSWVFLVVAKYITEGQGQGFQNFQQSILFGAETVFRFAVMVFATLFITGQAICCHVPGPGAAKGSVIASVICSVIGVASLVLLLLATLATQPGRDGAGSEVLVRTALWIAVALYAVGIVFYMNFLAGVAHHYRATGVLVAVLLAMLATVLFVVYYVVLHIVLGPQRALTLLTGNFMNFAVVGKAVEITFFVAEAASLISFFVATSLVGGTIRKQRLLRAMRRD